MEEEKTLILCVPGPWENRRSFLEQVVLLEPKGTYMYAGGILADIAGKDHVMLQIASADPGMRTAFEIAGRGAISGQDLTAVESHKSVAYMHFAADVLGEQERIRKFANVLRNLNGAAVKVETAGIAHSWMEWNRLLAGSPFDLYCAFVVLIGDSEHYYSCGMHQFGLPDCRVASSLSPDAAADLMNRFNYWRIMEKPTLESGHTFSTAPGSPHFQLNLERDMRYEPSDPFFNSHGIWTLESA